MKYSMVVMDDTLPHYERSQIIDYKHPDPWGRRWIPHNTDHPFVPIINLMMEYVPVNIGPLGLEMWKSCGDQKWHLDSDSHLYMQHGEVRLPTACAIYYPLIRDCSIHLWTDTVDVTPVSNRLIIFPPDTFHRPASGPKPGDERLALGFNLWLARPMDCVD